MSDQTESRSVSSNGVRFIAEWEGFRSTLYNDALGHCTIGYGHLVHRGRCNGSEPVHFKRGITREQGLTLLQQDIRSHASIIDAKVKVSLRQHQYDALASFVYNVGTGGFAGSTLLRKLNGGDYAAVPSELMRWTNGGLPGLVRRRRAEGELFKSGRSGAIAEDENVGREDSGSSEVGATDMPPPSLSTGADEGQHDSYGDNPVDVGETTDEPDTS